MFSVCNNNMTHAKVCDLYNAIIFIDTRDDVHIATVNRMPASFIRHFNCTNKLCRF